MSAFVENSTLLLPKDLLLSDVIERMLVKVEFPHALKQLVFSNEKNMTAVKMGIASFNNKIDIHPEQAIYRIHANVNWHPQLFYFRVHEVYFEDSLDLSYQEATMMISTTNNEMVGNIIGDGGLRFYLIGETELDDNGCFDLVRISKIKSLVNGNYLTVGTPLVKKMGECYNTILDSVVSTTGVQKDVTDQPASETTSSLMRRILNKFRLTSSK